MRDRAWRRTQTKKIQDRRVKLWKQIGWTKMDERHIGMMRKKNFSCGCLMCKPWKHGHGGLKLKGSVVSDE
jgi:hypothetical protein